MIPEWRSHDPPQRTGGRHVWEPDPEPEDPSDEIDSAGRPDQYDQADSSYQVDQSYEEEQSYHDGPSGGAGDELVRPFLVTGGRTHPLQDGLRIETVVSALPSALSAPLRFEARRIVELCQRPMAVVDVAVALRVPLGVARVLIADLIMDEYLRCDAREELPIELIERIRDRVRAL
jgi:hypothetical protein